MRNIIKLYMKKILSHELYEINVNLYRKIKKKYEIVEFCIIITQN